MIHAFLFFTFLLFSFSVQQYFWQSFDGQVTLWLQNNIQRIFDIPLSYFSLLGSFEITTLLVIVLFTFLLKKKNIKFYGLGLFFVALGIEVLGKVLIYHPSPPLSFFRYNLGFIFPSSSFQTGHSYPSGHMMRTAFLVVIFIFLALKSNLSPHRKYLIVITSIIITILMFISRIYLGEHWFSDVVGGMLLGASMAVLSIGFFQLVLPERKK